jgi:hypothetical protein
MWRHLVRSTLLDGTQQPKEGCTVRYRLGRHHKDTVYFQVGDEPHDNDPRVAIFLGAFAEDAAEFVEWANSGIAAAKTHHPWDEKAGVRDE